RRPQGEDPPPANPRRSLKRHKKKGVARPPPQNRVVWSLVAVPASAVAATAAAAAARLGPRFVDRERPSAELLAREPRDGVASLAVISEFDEPEALGPPGLPVGDHAHGPEVPSLGKEIAKILFAGGIGKVTNVQLHRTESFSGVLISDPVAPFGGPDFPLEISDFGAEAYERRVIREGLKRTKPAQFGQAAQSPPLRVVRVNAGENVPYSQGLASFSPRRCRGEPGRRRSGSSPFARGRRNPCCPWGGRGRTPPPKPRKWTPRRAAGRGAVPRTSIAAPART